MAAILRIPYLSLDKRRSDLPIAIKIVDPPALNLNGIGQVFAFRRGSRRLLLIPLHPSSSYNDVELQRLEERYRDALMGSSRLASLKALFTAVTTGTVGIEQVLERSFFIDAYNSNFPPTSSSPLQPTRSEACSLSVEDNRTPLRVTRARCLPR